MPVNNKIDRKAKQHKELKKKRKHNSESSRQKNVHNE